MFLDEAFAPLKRSFQLFIYRRGHRYWRLTNTGRSSRRHIKFVRQQKHRKIQYQISFLERVHTLSTVDLTLNSPERAEMCLIAHSELTFQRKNEKKWERRGNDNKEIIWFHRSFIWKDGNFYNFICAALWKKFLYFFLLYFSADKVKKKYSNLGHTVVAVRLERGPRGGLGISLAGHRDRSRMAVFVCGLRPGGAASRAGSVLVGDEILEVNFRKFTGKFKLGLFEHTTYLLK